MAETLPTSTQWGGHPGTVGSPNQGGGQVQMCSLSTADAPTPSGGIVIYDKLVAGVSHLFAIEASGVITQITPFQGVTNVIAGASISVSGGPAFTVNNTAPAPTLTNHAIVLGQGTTTPLFLAPSTANNVATSDGTNWTSAAQNFQKSGFTNGSIIGVVNLVVGAAAVRIADTLTMTGLPSNPVANIWYSFEAVNGPSTGSEITVDCRVDGTTMFTEALTFQTVQRGAAFPMSSRWTGTWRVTGLAAGTHTFDMFASCPSGANGASNTQNARIHVLFTMA